MNIAERVNEIAKHLGYETQSNQLIEECAELIKAVSTYRRATIDADKTLAPYKTAVALENLVEEIADVEIMLAQIKYLLKIPEEELEAMKIFKINRTREKLFNDN